MYSFTMLCHQITTPPFLVATNCDKIVNEKFYYSNRKVNVRYEKENQLERKIMQKRRVTQTKRSVIIILLWHFVC